MQFEDIYEHRVIATCVFQRTGQGKEEKQLIYGSKTDQNDFRELGLRMAHGATLPIQRPCIYIFHNNILILQYTISFQRRIDSLRYS